MGLTVRAMPVELAEKSGRSAASARSQVSHAVASHGVVLLLSILTNIIAARTLDPSQRGALAAGMQAAFFLSTFLLLGIDKSVPIVFNEQKMDKTIPFVWLAASRQGAVALLIGTMMTVVGLTADLGRLDPIFVFGLPTALMAIATMLDASFRSVAINANRSQLVLLSTATVGGLILAGVAGLSITDIRTVPVWLLLYGLARGGVSLALHLRNGQPTRTVETSQLESLRVLRRTGRRLWVASFANFAALRSDRLLLPILATTADLGVYVVVSTLTDVLAAPTEAIASVMIPRWRSAALAGKLRTAAILTMTLAYLSVSVAGLIVLGPWITELLFGIAYRPTTGLVVALSLASAVYGMNRLLSGRAMALGATRSVSTAELVGMVLAIVSYVALIPGLGTTGAALGSLIGYSATAIGLLIAGRTASGQPDAGDVALDLTADPGNEVRA